VYQGFYRFSRDPFAAPADARHIFMAAGHRDALSGVVLDVLKHRPFVAVGGDGEVGKTTVLNAALASLTDQRRRRPVRVTRLDHSRLTSLSARQIVAQLIGKRTGELIDHDLQHLFHTLTDCGRDGSQHVLVIDDAPSVNPGALEFLRLVVGLQTLDRTSLQVVLAGRNEFWETLIGDSGWATHDQVTNRAAVEPLADDEVRQYIDYRLQLADSSVERVVTDAALGDIIRHGQALPGRINRILDRAFTVGATQGFSRVTPRVVDEAVMFLEASNLLPLAPLAPARRPAAAPIVLNATSHEAATRIVPPLAVGRSTWLAGTAVAAVFGIALSAGMLLPRVLSHFAAPSVASVDAVTPTAAPAPAPVHATETAGEPATTDTAARTADDHPVATGEAPAETLSQPGPTVTARPAAAALPEPAPSTAPPGPPAEAVDPPTVSEPLAPSVQTAMGPSPARPEASAATRPAAADPAPSPDAQDRTRELVEARRLEPPPPEVAPAAADPAAMPPSPSAPPTASPLPPAILAVLLDRGAAMLATGDISAARLLYKRAADAGSAQAAAEIGKTYEPAFLANRRAIGIQADPTIAAGWYRRALSLGGTKAASLLAQPGVVIAR
jgi:type II secretory pathway predicted ATPase ExeA